MAPLIKRLSRREQPVQYEPKPEEISQLAYALYLKRGGGDGKDQEDWLQAETLLREKK